MSEIQFVRFRCSNDHISMFRYGTERVLLDYCAVCGDSDVEQIESQYVEADVEADSSLLRLEDK